MQAPVPLVSKQRCANAYPGEIDDSMLCTGVDTGGVGPCHGDSGGPLVCEFNGAWYLEGATSWGYGCARPCSMGYLLNWLSLNMYTVVAPTALPQNQLSSALGKRDDYNFSLHFFMIKTNERKQSSRLTTVCSSFPLYL